MLTWLITAPPGHFVKLNFTNFDLGGFDKYFGICNYKEHTLKLTSSNQSSSVGKFFQLGKYCGSSVPANVISFKRYLTLVFSSVTTIANNLPTKQGFRLEYSALRSPASYYNSMCMGWRSSIMYTYPFYFPVILKLNPSSNYQYIRSPLYPEKYPSNLFCHWHITASSSSKRIKAEVTDLKISNKVVFYCESIYYSQQPDTDTLEIRGGDNSARYCDLHNDTSRTVISSDQYMRIAFSTNSDNFFRGNTAGFELRFIEIPVGHTSILKFGIGIIILSQSLVQLI